MPSLLGRLLATSVLVAAGSVAATAWLAVHTTTQAIARQQSQELPADTRIYTTLLHYAATHPNWSGVTGPLADLAAGTGLDITLTGLDHQPIAGHGTPAGTPAATVDPLHVDSALSAAGGDLIDPAVVGPFLLPPTERDALHTIADQEVQCLADKMSMKSHVVDTPSGRPEVQVVDDYKHVAGYACYADQLATPTATEQSALHQLDGFVDACLAQRHQPPVDMDLDMTWHYGFTADSQIVQACVAGARREQLAPYVAPAALLYVAEPGQVTPGGFSLSQANVARIAAVTGLVLVLAVGLTVLVGVRMVRPLRILTHAVRAPGDHPVRVTVRSTDEIGTLAAAFNELSQRREHAEEQRRAMVGDIAHELRTPLTNIRGWLEGVEDGVVDTDPAWVSSMLEEVLLLQHVIDDLRDLAAADAGELRLHTEPVRPAVLLDQIAAAHRPRADTAGVRLIVDVTGDPELTADPVRLRQAVGNLVTNAVRHTPPGGTVTLCARRDGTDVVMAVTDTGAGIEPAELPHVFDRFWRAEKSRSRDTGGSGLGLAIVRQLAAAHGGTASVLSEPGTGTTVTLRLPMEERASRWGAG